MTWSKVLAHIGILSRKEAQRLLSQRAIEDNGEIINDAEPQEGLHNLKVGKHRFLSLVLDRGKWDNLTGNPGQTVMKKCGDGWKMLGRTFA